MRLFLLLICFLAGLPALAQDTVRLGVFGMVEDLSPLTVAGLRINLPNGTRVISPLGPDVSIAQGDTLAIALKVESGALVATRVLAVYPAVGPIAAVQGRTARLMGSSVHVPPDVALSAGQWVALSGFWSGETVITTNVRIVDGGGFGHLTGVIDRQDQLIGGSAVLGASQPVDGFGSDIWVLSGTPDTSGLRVQLMTKGVFGGAVDLVLWQGYASLPVASQTYMIHGTGIIGTARDAQMPTAGRLIARCAQAGRVVQTAPEGLAAAFDALGCARHTPAE